MSYTIFVVDDEHTLLETLERALSRRDHRVRTFDNASDALDAVLLSPPDLLLTDIRMPGHDGIWLLEQVSKRAPAVGVMMMTALGDIKMAVSCIQSGALDYLAKPFGVEELQLAVGMAIEKLQLMRENQAHRVRLETQGVELRGALEKVNQMLQCSMDMIIRALDWRERETKDHSCRVALFATAIARQMNLDHSTVNSLLVGGILHDIGKIGVSDAILLKPGPLSNLEREAMLRHPEIGYDIVSRTLFAAEARDVVLHHHERFDGGGYPHGLAGNQIPLAARIFALADTLDAITSHRPYRAAQPFERALAEIIRHSGGQFDPDIVSAFRQVDPLEWERIRSEADVEAWRRLDQNLSTAFASELMGLASIQGI